MNQNLTSVYSDKWLILYKFNMIEMMQIMLIFLISTTTGLYLKKSETEFSCAENWTTIDFEKSHRDEINLISDKCAIVLTNLPQKTLSKKIITSLPSTMKLMKISLGLTAIDEDFILELKQLKYLDLSGNNLNNSTIIEGDGKFCTNLQWLDLSYNELNNTDFLKTESPFMKNIQLNNNKLVEVPVQQLRNFQNLERLHLQRNFMRNFSTGSSYKFDSVKYLDASSNYLKHLRGLQFFPNLVVLNLSRNGIADLNFPFFEEVNYHLRELLLDGNHIEYLTIGTMFKLQNLEIFSLEGNNLRKLIPFSDEKMDTKLISINLGRNNLDDIPYNFFRYFPDLKILKLHDNKLENLRKDMFTNLNHLEKLDISGNAFSVLDEKRLIPLESLRELYLNENKINVIDYSALALHIPNLKKINFLNNPIQCYNLREMLDFFKNVGIEIVKDNDCVIMEKQRIEGFCCLDTIVSRNDSNIILDKINQAVAMMTAENKKHSEDLKLLLEFLANDTKNSIHSIEDRYNDNQGHYVTNTVYWTGTIILLVLCCIFIILQIFFGVKKTSYLFKQ